MPLGLCCRVLLILWAVILFRNVEHCGTSFTPGIGRNWFRKWNWFRNVQHRGIGCILHFTEFLAYYMILRKKRKQGICAWKFLQQYIDLMVLMISWKFQLKRTFLFWDNTFVKKLLSRTSSGCARNFLPGGLSPPKPTFCADTKPCFTCFRKFPWWAQLFFGWAEPTPSAATMHKLQKRPFF